MDYNKFYEVYTRLNSLEFDIPNLKVKRLSDTHLIVTYEGFDAGLFYSNCFHYVAQQPFNINKLHDELQKHI